MDSQPSSNPGRDVRGKTSLLETRVARRMLGLFLLCALLPTAVLAIVAYRHVASQLGQQSRERVRDASKALGMTLIERLQLSEEELSVAAREVNIKAHSGVSVDSGESRLDGLVLSRRGAVPIKVWGQFDSPVQLLRRDQVAHLAAGRTILVAAHAGDHPLVLMARATDPRDPEAAVLWAQVRLSMLLAGVQEDSSLVLVNVLANNNSVELMRSNENDSQVAPELRFAEGSGDLEWKDDGAVYLAGYWTAFLEYEWSAPSWTIVVSEPRERVLEPMSNFTRTFLLVVGISLVLVFLLSNSQIRRRMRPLVELRQGTLKVAQGEFTHRVELKTGDEFELLAGSFNTMAVRLGRQFTALTVANERLEQMSWGTLAALARTIDASSPWTAGHSERVTRLSLAIGRHLDLNSAELDRLHRGGLLHDIGKIGIPHGLLEKPGKLTDEEMTIVRGHPVTGARILAPITVFSDIIPIVRHHHEKFDGTGYPDRLERTGIPYLARIVAVADVYDALVSDRPYRPGWTPAAALELIQKTSGAHHDPAVVDAFTALIQLGGLDNLAELPSMAGETGEYSVLVGGGIA